MKASALKALLQNGGLNKYDSLYRDGKAQTERFLAAIDAFEARFGKERDICIFSVPGRSEILGNHTDHNFGCVLAGAIDRDIIAVASKNEDGVIRFHSEGYPEDTVYLSDIDDPNRFENYTSGALIAGVAKGFVNEGLSIGGYDAYTTTEVLKGSGISSSAAYEVMIGNIFNHLYNGSRVENELIAKLSQYAENVYFGKPCGLMDQMACALGGFVYIDFENPKSPKTERIDFSLSDVDYSLLIVNTGGNHADLNEDYASVPKEMKAVAAALGKTVLREVNKEELLSSIPALRSTLGDRAVMRALHFLRENERVEDGRRALLSSDVDGFLSTVTASGNSSFKYLQNVYTVKNVEEQGLSLALALAEMALDGKRAACRVHGGGFAGTVQIFVKNEDVEEVRQVMDAVFGEGATMRLSIRPLGASMLFA